MSICHISRRYHALPRPVGPNRGPACVTHRFRIVIGAEETATPGTRMYPSAGR